MTTLPAKNRYGAPPTDNSGRGCLETLAATSTARVMHSTPTPSAPCMLRFARAGERPSIR